MDTPHPHLPPPGHIAGKFKDPKTLAIVAVIAVAIGLYIRHRNASPAAAPDGVGTPVYDPNAVPQATQGAATGTDLTGGVDTSGSFSGMDTPPDWYLTPPSFLTDPPADPVASNDMAVVGVPSGGSVYDPNNGRLITAPLLATGGGLPKSHPATHKKPPKHKPHPASKPGAKAHKPPVHVKPHAPTTRATPKATSPHAPTHSTPAHKPPPPRKAHHG